jgi:hypothetical protein
MKWSFGRLVEYSPHLPSLHEGKPPADAFSSQPGSYRGEISDADEGERIISQTLTDLATKNSR